MDKPVIYTYLDYRAFLKDWIEYKKHGDKKFSYRFFSRRAGFSSTNFISLVIKGKRNLSMESMVKISRGFGLKKRERDFFENLVFMNQASIHEEKNHYYKKMISTAPYSRIKQLDRSKYEFFSKWYYPVILEIMAMCRREIPPERIAGLLKPAITPSQARKAVNLLLALELIKEEDGQWKKCEKFLTTGAEVKSLVVSSFHRAMMGITSDAIDSFPPETRDVSSMILSINSRTMKELKKKIDQFRNEVAELVSKDKYTDQVVCLNIQTFPLTEKIKGKSDNESQLK